LIPQLGATATARITLDTGSVEYAIAKRVKRIRPVNDKGTEKHYLLSTFDRAATNPATRNANHEQRH
jgi:hypothetical protein